MVKCISPVLLWSTFQQKYSEIYFRHPSVKYISAGIHCEVYLTCPTVKYIFDGIQWCIFHQPFCEVYFHSTYCEIYLSVTIWEYAVLTHPAATVKSFESTLCWCLICMVKVLTDIPGFTCPALKCIFTVTVKYISTLSTRGKIFSGQYIEIFFLFYPEYRFWHFTQIIALGDNLHKVPDPFFLGKIVFLFYSKTVETICMKCQILFSGKSKKNVTNLLSAELAKRVVKVNLPWCEVYFTFPCKRWTCGVSYFS